MHTQRADSSVRLFRVHRPATVVAATQPLQGGETETRNCDGANTCGGLTSRVSCQTSSVAPRRNVVPRRRTETACDTSGSPHSPCWPL
jgi:hypothetical protein